MSNYVHSELWRRCPVGGTKLLILHALADWADDDGSNVFPSTRTIAAKCRLSRSQTLKQLQQLVAEGLLTIEERGIGGNPMNTTRYVINVERLERMPIVFEGRRKGRSRRRVGGRENAGGRENETGRVDAAEGSRFREKGAASTRPKIPVNSTDLPSDTSAPTSSNGALGGRR